MNSKEIRSYKIDQLRYEELQRICWQYRRMKQQAEELITVSQALSYTQGRRPKGGHSDPTAAAAGRREHLLKRISAIERCAKAAGKENADGLLRGVITRGSSYEILQVKGHVFCGRRQFYEMRQKFFWLLDRELS